NDKGVSHFQGLQDWAHSHSGVAYAAFDCLYVNGQDLRKRPLAERRPRLEEAVEATGSLFPSKRLAANGMQAYDIAKRRQCEGIVAKDESSPYIEARSNKWLKVKVVQEEEFLIVGYTEPAGARSHFGALLLGAYDKGKLRYTGKVGTGFTRNCLER